MVIVTGPNEAARFLETHFLQMQARPSEQPEAEAADDGIEAGAAAPPIDPILRIDMEHMPLDGNGPQALNRFMTAMKQLALESNASSQPSPTQLEVVGFGYAMFDQHPNEALELLFGRVLPSLKSLKTVELFMSELHPHYLGALVNGLIRTGNTLHTLSLEYTSLSADCVRATIPQLIRRAGLQILHLDSCSLGSSSLQSIVQALPRSSLTELKCNDFFELSAEQARILGRSQLRVLDLTESPLSLDGHHNLIQALKSNETLQELHVSRNRRIKKHPILEAWHELLRAFNLNLTTLRVQPTCYPNEGMTDIPADQQLDDPEEEDGMPVIQQQIRLPGHVPQRLPMWQILFRTRRRECRESRHQKEIDRLLEANAALRLFHRQYQMAPPLAVAPSLWPRVVRTIGRSSTLLYRFLREDNLEAVLDRLRAPAVQRGTHVGPAIEEAMEETGGDDSSVLPKPSQSRKRRLSRC